MPDRFRVIAFDLDEASLIHLKEAFPAGVVEAINGATAASLAHDWNPGRADLLVVRARDEAAETLGLCRFLVRCSAFSTDARGQQQNQRHRADAPLLVLVSPGQEAFVRAALEAGAHSCLIMPIHAKEVASMVARAEEGNQSGRHMLTLDQARSEDRWRDDGGQG